MMERFRECNLLAFVHQLIHEGGAKRMEARGRGKGGNERVCLRRRRIRRQRRGGEGRDESVGSEHGETGVLKASAAPQHVASSLNLIQASLPLPKQVCLWSTSRAGMPAKTLQRKCAQYAKQSNKSLLNCRQVSRLCSAEQDKSQSS